MKTMPNRLPLITLILLLAPALGIDWTAAQEQPTLEVMELKFQQTQNGLAAQNRDKEELLENIRKNDDQIEKLKAKEQLSYLERQKLESLLKASQDVSRKIDASNARIRETQKRLLRQGEQLVKLYEAEIDKAVAKVEKSGQAGKNREALVAQIKRLRQKIAAIQSAVNMQKVNELRINELDISADDSPKQVRQKGDLLKDQEEKYRKRARELQLRAEALQKELDLRTRVSEMVEDLALFDQQEEALTNLNSQSQEATLNADPGLTDEAGRSLSQENILVGQKDFDFTTLSSHDIEDLIDNLSQQEQDARVSADSLSQRAEQFYRKAEELKKQ